jgi:phage terminase small subunit
MPVLKNTRHEKFAQALASGKSQLEAYEISGYKPHRGNASKLACENIILARVAELQQRIATIHEVANSKAAEVIIERYAITKERILDEMARMAFANMLDYIRIGVDGLPYCDFSAVDRDKGVAIQEVHVETTTVMEMGEEGERVPVQVRKARFKLADKRAALVDLGKHLGMFKTQLEVSKAPENRTSEELKAEILADMERLGIIPAGVLALPSPEGVANRPTKNGNGTTH